MAKITSALRFPPKRYYTGAHVPMRVIRRYARAIVEQFHPDKIILFGSHAYGTPHPDSDVDILVVIPARNQRDMALKIRSSLEAPFPMDLIVRTPNNMKWRLEAGDWFLRDIVAQGKVLYEPPDAGVGPESRSRPHGRSNGGSTRRSGT